MSQYLLHYSLKYHYKYDIRDQHDKLYNTKYKNYKSKTKNVFRIPGGYSNDEKFSKSNFGTLTQPNFSDGILITMQMLSDPSFMVKNETTNLSSVNKPQKHG
jgi:hypothetical protein